jgi:hypothetical protein
LSIFDYSPFIPVPLTICGLAENRLSKGSGTKKKEPAAKRINEVKDICNAVIKGVFIAAES